MLNSEIWSKWQPKNMGAFLHEAKGGASVADEKCWAVSWRGGSVRMVRKHSRSVVRKDGRKIEKKRGVGQGLRVGQGLQHASGSASASASATCATSATVPVQQAASERSRERMGVVNVVCPIVAHDQGRRLLVTIMDVGMMWKIDG